MKILCTSMTSRCIDLSWFAAANKRVCLLQTPTWSSGLNLVQVSKRKYGDKLSSVLDIHYRKPTESTTRTTASTLGAQIQHDNVWGPVTMNLGLRYRNNRYILSTLDERGEYAPTYIDAQTYLTWDPDGYGPWEIQALGVYGKNDFLFFPDTKGNQHRHHQPPLASPFTTVKNNLLQNWIRCSGG